MKDLICSNPWCKSITKVDDDYEYKQCYKCISFNNDLSNGVDWEDKNYDGIKYDGPHKIDIKIQRASDNKRW